MKSINLTSCLPEAFMRVCQFDVEIHQRARLWASCCGNPRRLVLGIGSRCECCRCQSSAASSPLSTGGPVDLIPVLAPPPFGKDIKELELAR